MSSPEHPEDQEKTQTWAQLARERRQEEEEEENPALIEEDDPFAAHRNDVSDTASKLIESGDGIEWIQGAHHGDTDDNLTPYTD